MLQTHCIPPCIAWTKLRHRWMAPRITWTRHQFLQFYQLWQESHASFKNQYTFEKNISKAKRLEFARVYSVQNMVTPLERNVVFHRTVQNIDECLVEIARKMTRPLEFHRYGRRKIPQQKSAGLFLRNIRQKSRLNKSAAKSGTPRLPSGRTFKKQYLQN
jgi:hypothetical protein